jgi:MmyB-like transcription regulator ligand binding domain
MPCVHRNTLWCCVTEPSARGKFAEYDSQIRYMVARLRSAYGLHVGDPDWEEDIRRRSASTPCDEDTRARMPLTRRDRATML